MGFSFSIHGEQPNSAIPASVRIQLNEADKNFTFEGQPINPLGIKLLQPWISDGLPGTASIYLEGTAKNTNQFTTNSIQNNNGVISVDFKKDDPSTGYFSYRHLGVLANGSHVLEIWEGGGGSGIWTDLLLVKFSADPEYQEDGSVKYRLVLTRTGAFDLGDRFDGSLMVQPHKIIIAEESNFHHDPHGRTINFK